MRSSSASRFRFPAGVLPSSAVWHETQLRSRIGFTSRQYSTFSGPSVTNRRPASPSASHFRWLASFASPVTTGVVLTKSHTL